MSLFNLLYTLCLSIPLLIFHTMYSVILNVSPFKLDCYCQSSFKYPNLRLVVRNLHDLSKHVYQGIFFIIFFSQVNGLFLASFQFLTPKPILSFLEYLIRSIQNDLSFFSHLVSWSNPEEFRLPPI